MEEAADLFLAAERAVKWCHGRIKELQPPGPSSAATPSSGSLTTKLPKLTLPSFSGGYTLAFPVQANSNIYATAQPGSQPEMLSSHWRSHPPPQYVSNACIKLPPIQIPQFDGDPLAFHDWINIFKASVHENTSISQTHRVTYLQNSVSGKAKDLIRGYSCNPAFLHFTTLPWLN